MSICIKLTFFNEDKTFSKFTIEYIQFIEIAEIINAKIVKNIFFTKDS